MPFVRVSVFRRALSSDHQQRGSLIKFYLLYLSQSVHHMAHSEENDRQMPESDAVYVNERNEEAENVKKEGSGNV